MKKIISKTPFVITLLFFTQVLSGCTPGRAYVKDAIIADAMGDYEKAIRLNTKAINAGDLQRKALATVHTNRGHNYLKKGSVDKAVEDFSYAVDLNPYYPEGYYGRALAYSEKGELDRSIKDFGWAIKYKKDYEKRAYIKAYRDRGYVYAQNGDFINAIADFDTIIKLQPGVTIYLIMRGLFYAELQEYDDAVKNWNKALSLNKKDVTPIVLKGAARYAQRDFEGAVTLLNEAVSVDPANSNANIWLYIARARNNEDAKERLSEFLKSEKSDERNRRTIKMYLEEITPDDFLGKAIDPNPRQDLVRKLEAYFHVAQYYIIHSEQDRANAFLRSCVDTGKRGNIESVVARAELEK